MKKIKIFLGAYVNFPNAQNINCDNIAKYIDKERFEVHALYTSKMPVDKDFYKKQGIYLHRLIHHRYIWYWSKLLIMLLARCDIYYLPKMEGADKTLVKLLKRKAKFISSIEGGIGAQIPADDTERKEWFESMDGVFSISRYIQQTAREVWNMETPVLYLGIDMPEVVPIERRGLSNVIWIGSIIRRKHPELLLEVAREFSNLNFLMIGDGDIQDEIKKMIRQENVTNVTLTGRLPNNQVYEKLKEADLLLMTSDKEGLPKVIGEAMAMSVPAIYINEYYDVDYVVDGQNGYAVRDVNEMKERIHTLLGEAGLYRSMSRNAAESISTYLWKELIKQYEAYFCRFVS